MANKKLKELTSEHLVELLPKELAQYALTSTKVVEQFVDLISQGNINVYFNYYFKNLKYLVHNESSSYKIPLISHHIWLTNNDSPREIGENDIKNLIHTLEVLDNKEGSNWSHILWTNSKSAIPNTILKLQNKNIEVREIGEAKDQLVSYDRVTKYVAAKKFGVSVDILREDVLKVYGGFYSDLNYLVTKSPEEYMQKFDFYTDASSFTPENFCIVAAPLHPIITHAMDITFNILDILETKEPDFYTTYSDHSLVNRAVYFPFVAIVAEHANKHGTIDFGFSDVYNKYISLYPKMEEDIIAIEEALVKDDLVAARKLYHAFRAHLEDDSIPCTDLSFGKDNQSGEAQTWILD